MIKFRTELRTEPLPQRIGYGDGILCLGSCFADELRERLRSLKFRAAGNFSGPLYNPSSLAEALRRAEQGTPYRAEELHRSADGSWFHYDTNTFADGSDRDEVLARCNAGLEALRRSLAEARHVVVTFGTAWVYRLRETGRVVANCHKQPQALFERQRLTPDEIVGQWAELLAGTLEGKQVILSVSPIRHLGDGLQGNSLSKAVLRVAAGELSERFDNVCYFPAFELLTDDLRDYRFYADDLVHPSRQAVEYIWEGFARAALTDEARALLKEVERLVAACRHRPIRPDSPAWQEFRMRTLAELVRLQQHGPVDFSDEIRALSE